MPILHAKQALGPDGWLRDVQIETGPDGRIAGIGAQVAAAPDHRVDLALPAPVNLHSHAFQRAMSGLTETRGPDPRDSFWTWRRLMYRFLDRLTPDDVQAIAAQVFMEMLEAGYSGVAEFHYLHHDVGGLPYAHLPEMAERIIAAAQETGIGLTMLPVLYQFGGCDERPLAGGQRRFGNDIDQFARLFDGVSDAIAGTPADYRAGVAPHSLRGVNRAGLAAAQTLCSDGPVHMHLAEQVAEVEEVEAHWQARPAEWLLDNCQVDARWCLIHCTQMTRDEIRELATTGAVAGLCPITESSLGDGIFRGVDFLVDQGRIGFGSDSNIEIALFHELKTLEYSQRLRDRNRAALATQDKSTGRVLIEHAARGGAQAAGRGSGLLAVGQFADILGVASDNPWVCGRTGDAALDSLIFGGHGQECITDVWSAGRHVVQQGRHRGREATITRFMDVVTRLGQDI